MPKLVKSIFLTVAFVSCLLGGAVSVHAQTDLLPDIYVAPSYLYDNDISTTTIPGRTVLRLSNGTANIGLGKLYLYGVLPSNGDGTQNVNQRIYRTNGTFYDRPAGRFIYHNGHNHIHVENWSIFRLRTVTAGDGVGSVVAQGSKTSFCILDLQIYNSSLPNYNPSGEFLSCASTTQGLSVGWVDIYNKYLEGQNIDITNVAPGVYWLEAEVDPGNACLESNEANNITRIKVTIGTPATINADAYEPNNSISAVNGRVEGAINSPNLGPCAPLKTINNLTIQGSSDPDFFKFYINSTGTASDFIKVNFQHALGDVDVELLNTNGVRQAISQGIVDNETISLNGRAKGWYFLRIYGYNGATHPGYSLVIDPPANGAPTITPTAPPVGNVNVLHAVENYTVRWNYSDPENDNGWVTVYVNSTPSLNGNQILLPTSINTPASAGLYNINTAELPLGRYYVYCEVNDAGTVRGSWAPGTITLVDNLILGSIAGTVTDQGGAPLQGATVELLNIGQTRTTDANGRFQFDTLLTGAYSLGFIKAGYIDTTLDAVSVNAPDTTQIAVALRPVPPPVAPIGGTIVDTAGAAISGVTITIESPQQQTTSDGNGVYSFAGMLSGNYSLTFQADGYFDTTIVGVVHSAPAATTKNVTMRRLPPPVGSIAGVVTDSTGTPIEGALVGLVNPLVNVVTDSSGSFAFTGLLSGSYAISFSASGFVDSSLSGIVLAAPATTNLSMKLRSIVPTGTINGVVRDESLNRLAGVTVSIPLLSLQTTTNDSGNYAFEGLISGDYALTFAASGFFDTTLFGVVHIAPGTTTANMTLREIPPPVGSIAGQVLSASGDSIAGAVVSLINPALVTSSGADGRFSFDTLLAGNYAIFFSAAGYVDTALTSISHNPPAQTSVTMVMRLIPPPMGAITGLVTDTFGLAVSGASVSLLGTLTVATTNDSGWFVLNDLISGDYDLAFSGNGFFDTTLFDIVVNAPDTTAIAFSLTPTPPPVGAIAGTVTDSVGSPLVGALVTMASPSQSFSTDSTGSFAFGALLAGNYELTISASGYFDTTISNIAHNPPAATNLTVALRAIPPPVGSFFGWVRDEEDLPLVGAAVSIPALSMSTATDSTGYFELNGLLSGSYSLLFSAAGYFDSTIADLVLTAPDSTEQSVSLREVPPPVGSIAGIVTDSLGTPLSGALVSMTNPFQSATTDSTGGFSFDTLLAGSYELTISAAGYFDTTISGIAHNPPSATNLTIALRAIPPPVGNFFGWVRDEEGLPLVGAAVSIPALSISTATDSTGYYELNGLLSGSYTILFAAAGYFDSTIADLVLTAPDSTEQSVSLRELPPPVGAIAGLVTDSSGNPLIGALVTMTNPSQFSSTDSAGAFNFDALLAGSYELTISASGFFDTTISGIAHNPPSATNLTIALRAIPPPVGTLSGLVTDSAGNPLGGVLVTLVSPEQSVISAGDGTFAFSDLLSGTYALTFSLAGYADSLVENIALVAPDPTGVTISLRQLPPVGEITGLVTNQTATPIVGATVEIQSLALSMSTSATGQFSFAGLLSGSYDLKFTAAGYFDTTLSGVLLSAPSPTSLTVAMRPLPPPVGAIYGTVRNQAGVEMVGVSVQLLSPARTTTTSTAGQFTFADLLSGLYSVRFILSGYADTTVTGITLTAPSDYSKTVILRQLSNVPVADAYEPNNSLVETAGKVLGAHNSPNLGPMGPLTTINSLSIHSTTSDYYQFTINATGTSSDFVRISFLHSQGDIDMDLLSTTNNILGRSAGSGNTETISLNNLAKGNYQLRIYGYNGAKNPNYSLTIDPPANQPPSITTNLPSSGNIDLVQGFGNARVNWTFSDPENDRCWVSTYVNSSPLLDGNQLMVNSIKNTDAALREAVIPTASIPAGRYYVYTEITDAGQKTGSWSPGTITVVNGVPIASLTGTILSSGNAVVAGANVTLVNPAMSAVTDSLGRFTFSNLASGNYAIKVTALDHYDTTVTSLGVAAPISTDAEIALTPLPRESDNFNDGDISNWLAVGGLWSVPGGVLKGNGDNLDAVLRSPFAQYGACELTAKMRISIYLDRKARLIFGYIDANNYRFVEVDESNDRWRIGERVSGVNTILASLISPITQDTWYNIRASVSSTGLVTLRVGGNVITSWQFASVINGRIAVGYSRGNVDFDDVTVIGIPTSPAPADDPIVVQDDSGLDEAGLGQNYPNPFNPVTQISFSVPTAQHVRLTVFNILGEVVRELVNEEISAGNHAVEWDGNNANGNAVASGVYFYQLHTERVTQSKKMMLVK